MMMMKTAALVCLVLSCNAPSTGWCAQAFTPPSITTSTTLSSIIHARPQPSQKAAAAAQSSYRGRHSPSSRLYSADPTSFLEVVGTIGPLVLPHVARDMATGGALSMTGDFLAQSLTANKNNVGEEAIQGNNNNFLVDEWDVVRTAAMGTFGALYTGGAQHFIFNFINEQVHDPIHRLALAQFCFIPFLYYPTYLLLVPALRSLAAPDPEAERTRLRNQVLERLPATLVRNWSFWVPVQFIQFSMVPPELQVTYCAAFGVVWNAILSWSTMQQGNVPMPSSQQTSSSSLTDVPSSRRETPLSVASKN
uniref:Peroxisomal membrane protein MPV17 n=1 Tax=Amphora coffeiformis TaxID=265554 RepID=A0A7S3P9H4_9STRA